MTTTTGTASLFQDIDRMDATAFASYMADDCVLRFANWDEVVGRDAIKTAIAAFFESINGLEHRILNQWTVDETTIVQFEVTYTRKDDRAVTVPAVTIFRKPGELIDDYRIYVDLTPVYA
jgi:ketosteroid isomerase-like protein